MLRKYLFSLILLNYNKFNSTYIIRNTYLLIKNYVSCFQRVTTSKNQCHTILILYIAPLLCKNNNNKKKNIKILIEIRII